MVNSQANLLRALAKPCSQFHISESVKTVQNPLKGSGFGLPQPGQNLFATIIFSSTAKEDRNKKIHYMQDILFK